MRPIPANGILVVCHNAGGPIFPDGRTFMYTIDLDKDPTIASTGSAVANTVHLQFRARTDMMIPSVSRRALATEAGGAA